MLSLSTPLIGIWGEGQVQVGKKIKTIGESEDFVDSWIIISPVIMSQLPCKFLVKIPILGTLYLVLDLESRAFNHQNKYTVEQRAMHENSSREICSSRMH